MFTLRNIGSFINSLKVFCLTLALGLLTFYTPLYATDHETPGTLQIDSTFLQTLQSSWQHIEKSFYILDSDLSPTTWQEFSHLTKDNAFKPVDKNEIPLHPKQDLWLKMRIENKLLVKVDLAFSIKSGKADVFITGQGKTEHKAAGDFYPRSTWDSEINFSNVPDPYIVTLQLNPNESKDIVIKLGPFIKNKAATIRLTSFDFAYRDLSSWYSMRNLIQGLCLGMLLIMLFYNLLTYLASGRDHIYLLNSLYIFCLTFWFFETFKLDKLTFFAEYPLLTELIRVPAGYGIGAFYLLFSQAMIGKQHIPSHLNKALKYYLRLLVLGISISNLMVWMFFTFNLFSIAMVKLIFPPIGLLGILISLYFIFHMFRLKSKLSNIIAISSCFVILGAGMAVFGDFIFLAGITSDSMKTANFSYALIIEIAFIIQMLLFGFALGIRAKELEKEKVKLEELDAIKSHFFTNISHEFRTPLTLLLSPIKQVLSELKNKTHAALLETSYKSGYRLLDLINQILDLSKIESNNMPLKISLVNVVNLYKDCLLMFESRAKQRNIRLGFTDSTDEILLFADQDKMEKIAINLIANAIKYNKDNGSVEIIIEEVKDAVIISIKDEGIGMKENELGQVFNRFYQADSTGGKNNFGSGIGLALVKELVELHQGKITVESKVNEGTTFNLWLKKGEIQFDKVEVIPPKSSEQFADGQVMPDVFSEKTMLPISPKEETPIVLIIEDHPELHLYIKSLLSTDYQVLSAYNGLEGIDKAIKVIPDLIISDLMMPEKDGLEVCKTIKTDERTSHIPFIMLTAKADIETKIAGLEIGADDYIAKPFDHQELVARIKNLLHQRSVWRQKFKDELHFVPAEISSNHADRRFIQRVLEVVHSKMNDEAFGVDELALEMAMSRTQLNRKLRDLLDQSTNKFIQSCRLQKAVELLKNPGHNVADIAHSTGFSSDAYFVKCFKEHFGTTPGKYFEKE